MCMESGNFLKRLIDVVVCSLLVLSNIKLMSVDIDIDVLQIKEC